MSVVEFLEEIKTLSTKEQLWIASELQKILQEKKADFKDWYLGDDTSDLAEATLNSCWDKNEKSVWDDL